eukprot:scaffold166949_cov32-Tisochrysis_lutea.AAC.13
MEDGQLKLDVAKVSRAVLHAEAARSTRARLVRDAQPPVEYAAHHWLPYFLLPSGGRLVRAVVDHLELSDLGDLGRAKHAKLDV